jgi:hypothetical protein
MLHSAVSMPQKLVPSLSRKARWFKASALLLAASLGLTLAARGAQQAQPATRSVLIQSQSSAKDKPNLPVQITVTGKAEYLLDTGSLTPEEYKKKVEKAAESGRPLPTPAVDLTVKSPTSATSPWNSGPAATRYASCSSLRARGHSISHRLWLSLVNFAFRRPKP